MKNPWYRRGPLITRKIKQPVQVVSDHLNIRNLDPKSDKVEIFGFDGNKLKAVRTDHDGRLEVVAAPSINTLFNEETFLNLSVTNQLMALPVQNTATKTVTSYAVINRGSNPAIVRAEISPNSIDFVTDQEDVVPPKSMKVFVPNRFMKWTRLSLSTGMTQDSTEIDVYFQAQTTGN